MNTFPVTDGCIVFDVGGTSLRCARYVAHTGELVRQESQPTVSLVTHPELSPEEICTALIQQLAELGTRLAGGVAPRVASIAFAGPIDPQGRILAAPTIWGRGSERPFDLASALSKFWPETEIAVLNDVTAAGYRYLRHAKDDLCIVTVSSGIGNKVFIDGRPLVGPGGRGGEIGHVRVDHTDCAPQCDCGHSGHLGAVASGRGTLALVRRLADEDAQGFKASALGRLANGDPAQIDNRQIVRAFHDGDAWTASLLQRSSLPLAQVLAAIHLAIGIERFVVFGGFAIALGDRYRKSLVDAARRCTWNVGQDWNSMLELGLPDDDSGLIGAGRYFAEFHRKDDDGSSDERGTIQLPGPIRRRHGRLAA